jgi:hypothetical protein
MFRVWRMPRWAGVPSYDGHGTRGVLEQGGQGGDLDLGKGVAGFEGGELAAQGVVSAAATGEGVVEAVLQVEPLALDVVEFYLLALVAQEEGIDEELEW